MREDLPIWQKSFAKLKVSFLSTSENKRNLSSKAVLKIKLQGWIEQQGETV